MVLRILILTISTLGGCGGLDRTDFLTFSTLGEYRGVLKELICNIFYFVMSVVVLKEQIFNIFYFGEGVVGSEGTDF